MSSVQDLAEPGPRGTRRESASSRLRRLGFVDATRAQNLLEDKDLVDVLGAVGPTSPLVGAVGGAADPDLALLALVLQQHFSGFKGNKIHALHTSRSAKLAGLFVQLCHVGGTGIAPAEQLSLFLLAAFVFCSAVRHAARQKAHAAE